MMIRLFLILLLCSCNIDSSIDYATESETLEGDKQDTENPELPDNLSPPGRGSGTVTTTSTTIPQNRIDGAKGDSTRGEPIYTNRCKNCHGEQGQGVGSKPKITEHTNFDFDEVLKRGSMKSYAQNLSLQELHDLKAYVDTLPD